MSFSSLVRADLLHLRATRLLLVLLLVGVGLLVVSCLGLAQQAGTDGAGAQDATLAVVRNGFSMSLFSALFGALAVSGRFATGEGARAYLARPSWPALLASQALVAGGVGLAFGLVGAGVATACAAAFLPGQDVAFSFGATTLGAVAGVVGVVVAAALWGVAIGALAVRPALAAGVIVVQLLVLEPALVRVWDTGFQFLFSNAMNAVYGDEQSFAVLPVAAGGAVLVAWLALAAGVALRRRARRDVPMGAVAS